MINFTWRENRRPKNSVLLEVSKRNIEPGALKSLEKGSREEKLCWL